MTTPAPLRDDEPATESLVGRVLEGRYRIESRLGEGGLGTVYRAQHLKLARAVAVKVLREDLRSIPQIRARFEREVKALSSLAHPNVVTITDYGVADGSPYLVMELVEGVELGRVTGAPIAPPRALAIVRQILASLAYAHERDVVHRDLKPANVIVRQLPDGRDHVVVLDFGLAKFVGDDAAADLTRSGLVVGTPAYMPPEQMAAGARRADARSDLYSAGLILFELLAGRRPFQFDDPADLLRAHLVMEPPTLSEALGGAPVSPALQSILDRALAKTPDDRFASAKKMIEAIDALSVEPLIGAVGAGPGGGVRGTHAMPGSPAMPGAPAGPAAVPGSPAMPGSAAVRAVAPSKGEETRPARPTPISQERSGHARRPAMPRPAGKVLAAIAAGALVIAGIAWASGGSDEETAPIAATPETRSVGPGVTASAPGPGHGGEGATLADAVAAAIAAEQRAAAERRSEAEASAAAAGDDTESETLAGDDEIAAAELAEPDAPVVAAQVGPRPAARNPLRGRLPGVMGRVRTRLQRGRDISSGDIRALARYRNEHPLDPRVRLILGHAYVSRGWYTQAIEQYDRAMAIDASVRGDPDVLEGLLRMVRSETVSARASDAVVRIYGDEARAAVGRALERETDPQKRARLESLRARLRSS